jgi:hypothetical protein
VAATATEKAIAIAAATATETAIEKIKNKTVDYPPKLTLPEKRKLAVTLVYLTGSAGYHSIAGLFRGKKGARYYFIHVAHAIIREALRSMTCREWQYVWDVLVPLPFNLSSIRFLFLCLLLLVWIAEISHKQIYCYYKYLAQHMYYIDLRMYVLIKCHRYLTSTTRHNYESFARGKHFQPQVVHLERYGGTGYWIGDKKAKNVIVYFHG